MVGTMNEELHKGFAIIIDNLLPESVIQTKSISKEKKQDNIFKIVEQVEKKGIPYCLYNNIPEDRVLIHFENINFILFFPISPRKYLCIFVKTSSIRKSLLLLLEDLKIGCIPSIWL